MASESNDNADTMLTSYQSFNVGGVSTSDVTNTIPNKITIPTSTNITTNEQEENEKSSEEEDEDLLMIGFNQPTPRDPEEDIVLALQETTDESFFNKCLNKLMSSTCGCCCCCVYTSSTKQSKSQSTSKIDVNYISESSPLYWTKYPFMKQAHRMWKIFFLCYFILSIPYIYLSYIIFNTSCNNHDINHALSDIIDLNDSSSNFCNLYYWIYIWFSPLLFLIITYITERVTLHNDMRGDRLICLLNVICLIIIIYLFVFFNYINDLLIDNICIDYQYSESNLLRNGCKDQINMYPIWVLCNTIYLIFISINIIHERVISLYLTLYDFKPKIVRHRAAQSYKKRKASASKFKRKSRRICTKQYWNNHLIEPSKTALYHVIFNIFHLDRHNMKLGVLYVWSEIKRNNFSFFIGLFTVFISCFVGAFLPAINDKSPVVFVKLAENSVGENDMLLTAAFSGSTTSTSSQSINNNTHNETLSYTYNNDWLYDYGIVNISNILSENNITETQLENMLQDINTSTLSNTSNITRTIMNITGLSYKRLNNVINFWNDNNDNITIENFEELINNYTQEIDENLAVLNLTEGVEKDWKVQVANQLFGTNPMLNYTYIENKLFNVPEISGSAPRWWLLANVTAGKSPYAVSTIVMAIDSILELEAGIGRYWASKHIKPLENNDAYIMNSITRAMNISGTGITHNYNDAIGSDFTMFANVGGFQDSFDIDFAEMYLNTNGSVIMEQNLIQNGIAYSCISVYIYPNERPNDFYWIIYNGNDTLIEGTVYINTNTCINATETEYIFKMSDTFGNGLNDNLNDENSGYYIVYWDDEIAIE
eukprot:182979_1